MLAVPNTWLALQIQVQMPQNSESLRQGQPVQPLHAEHTPTSLQSFPIHWPSDSHRTETKSHLAEDSCSRAEAHVHQKRQLASMMNRYVCSAVFGTQAHNCAC